MASLKDFDGKTALVTGAEVVIGARARPYRFGGERRMDLAISGQWREAQTPDVMWPHIEATLNAGGGYLVCATDPGLIERYDARQARIREGFRAVYDTAGEAT